MKLLYPLIILFAFSFAEDISEDIIQRYATGEKKVLVKYQGKGSSEKLIERIIYSLKGDTLAIEYPLDSYMKLFWDSENESEYSNPLYKLVDVGYSIEHLNGSFELFFENGIISSSLKDGELDGFHYVINSSNDTLFSTTYVDGIDIYAEERAKKKREEAKQRYLADVRIDKWLVDKRFKAVDGAKKTYWEFSRKNIDITIRGRGIKRESYNYEIRSVDDSTFIFIESNDTINYRIDKENELLNATWKGKEYAFKYEDI